MRNIRSTSRFLMFHSLTCDNTYILTAPIADLLFGIQKFWLLGYCYSCLTSFSTIDIDIVITCLSEEEKPDQIQRTYWWIHRLWLMQTPSDYFFSTLIYISGCGCSRVVLRDKVTLRLLKLLFKEVDVVEWSRALDIRLSEWCCSVSMVWVQIPSREEQKFDSSKI